MKLIPYSCRIVLALLVSFVMSQEEPILSPDLVAEIFASKGRLADERQEETCRVSE